MGRIVEAEKFETNTETHTHTYIYNASRNLTWQSSSETFFFESQIDST
jgi:hypothetical protein